MYASLQQQVSLMPVELSEAAPRRPTLSELGMTSPGSPRFAAGARSSAPSRGVLRTSFLLHKGYGSLPVKPGMVVTHVG